MKSAAKICIYGLLLAIGIGVFVNLVIQTGVYNIFETLKNFSLLGFLAFWLVYFTNFLFLTWRWAVIIKHFHKKKVPFWRLMLHRFSGWAVSYLTPSAQVGGEPVRVMFLGQEGVRRRDAVFSVIVDKAVQLTGLSLFGFVGFIFLLSRHLLVQDVFWTLVMVLTAVGAFLFWFYYASMSNIGFFSSILRLFRLHKLKRFQTKYNKVLIVEEAIRTFHTNHWKQFIWLVALSFLAEIYEMAEFWLIGHFMGFDFSFAETFVIKALPNITLLLPIPAGLGVLEGGHAAIFAILGIPINVIAFALILRIRDLINVFVGLAHISGNGAGLIKRYFTDKFGKGFFRKRYPKLFG
jgi:glycosyltransferase 2 family protein